jgi:hypothetical protein
MILDSFMPDLKGVESVISVTLISLEAARKNRRLILEITFNDLPNHKALKNRSWLIFFFSRYMIPATVDLVRSVRRLISL